MQEIKQLFAFHKPEDEGKGSIFVVSRAAEAIVPEFSASIKSSSLTALPLPTFIIIDVFFITDNVSLLMVSSVSSEAGKQQTTKSA